VKWKPPDPSYLHALNGQQIIYCLAVNTKYPERLNHTGDNLLGICAVNTMY